MKRSLLLLLFTPALLNGYSQCEDWVWGDIMGGTPQDEAWNASVATHTSGNAVLAGVFNSATTTIGSNTYTNMGQTDDFVVMYDDQGNVQWSRHIGSLWDERVEAIATDYSGSSIVVGYGSGDTMVVSPTDTLFSSGVGTTGFAIKYDFNGNLEWAKKLPTPFSGGPSGYNDIRDVATDPFNNIYITGRFNGDTMVLDNDTIYSTIPGVDEMYLAKFDPSGSTVFLVNTGLEGDEQFGVAADHDGNAIIGAHYRNSTPVSAGNLTIPAAVAGTHDLIIMKANGSGDLLWFQTVGGTGDEFTNGVAVDNDNNIYITGGFFSASLTFGSTTLNNTLGIEMFLAKYSPSGVFNWALDGTGNAIRYGTSVAVNEDNEVYFTGLFDAGGFNFDTVAVPYYGAFSSYLAKVSTDGAGLWAVVPEGSDTTVINKVSTSLSDHLVYVAGATKAPSVILGEADTLANTGNMVYDTWIGQVDDLDANLTMTNPTCGNADGTVTLTVSNGTPPYSYNWSTGDSTAMVDSLTAGLYQGTLTDAIGCSLFGTFILADSDGPTVTLNETEPSCTGASDGIMDITVTGGTPPYTYLWSNGATTEDITGLMAGPYEVEVSDANGCIGSVQKWLQEPDPLVLGFQTTSSTCTQSDGTATVLKSGGIGPYTYLWSTSATTSFEMNLAAGIYMVTVTDANSCVDSIAVSINDVNGPLMIVDSIQGATCGNNNGIAFMQTFGGTPGYNYNWSNGGFLQNLFTVGTGIYTCTVTDNNNCKGTVSVEIDQISPTAEPICLVTVDTSNNDNVVVWEKTGTSPISSYNVYRETSVQGVYALMGSVPFDSLSIFIDQGANSTVKSYRYKITSVDTCGFESDYSTPHKTMHLNVNLGTGGKINLIWDHYEGFTFGTYYINRWSVANGWEVLDSVTSASTSFTDTLPPTGILEYTVEARPAVACVATRAQNYNSSRSNRTLHAAPVSLVGYTDAFDVRVYPNPTQNLLTVQTEGLDLNNAQLRLLDIQGRTVLLQSTSATSTTLDLSSQAPGIYTLQMLTGEHVINAKVIVQ